MCSSSQACITINAQPVTPAALTLTGTTLCASAGTTAGSITTSASVVGVSYQLQTAANVNVGSPVAGTGSALIFTGLSAGSYRVVSTGAAPTNCTATSANASVTTVANPIATAVVTQPTCFVATGTITVTSATAGLTFSINGTTYTNTSGIFTGVVAGTYSLTAKNAAGCISASTSVTVNAQPVCVICSYTQGFYGNKNGLNLLQSSGILNTPLIIGSVGLNTITITSADIIKLNNSLPGGGTPRALVSGTGACNISNTSCFDANYLTQQRRINNNLLSQTITLSLNVRLGTNLNNVPIQSGCLLTSGGSYTMNQNVVTYLSCRGTATVSGLLTLANAVLGGSLTPGQNSGGCVVPSFSDINNAVDAINNAFDECKNYNGYGTCTTTSRASNTEVSITKDEISSYVKVNVSPNPYHDNVTFNIESNISGKAILEIFNLTGQKLNTVFEGNLSAGKGQNIRFMIPEQKRSNLIYRLRVGEKTTTGKILYVN